MAITINNQILGQQASSVGTYCYLYEPLRIVVQESSTEAQKIYIDLEVQDTLDNTNIIEDISKYGEFDLNPGQPLSIDIMKLAQQHHDAQVFKYSNVDEIVEDQKGWNSLLSKYKYNFKIYSEINTTPVSVVKLPILGSRFYPDFVATVSESQNLNEAQVHGINLNDRWLGYPTITSTLANPDLQDSKPDLQKVISTKGQAPCGGYLLWKSRLGGWMTWGFDIQTKSFKKKYDDKISVGMFESTETIDGKPFIPVDYTGIETSYSLSLKSLSLSMDELKAVAGISSSPAVYYMKDTSGDLELMRLTSSSAPISSLASGGDFQVSLSSISNSFQKTR